MKLELVDVENAGQIVAGPYLVRIPGWTWERYIEEAPESRFCEFVEGELIMPSPVDWTHQQIVRFLTCLLQLFCSRRGLGVVGTGPALIRVALERGREPDIFVLPPEQAAKARGRVLEVCPSLIVEVASPSTRSIDLNDKAEEYAALGVLEYWIVDAERRTLHILRLRSGAHERQAVTAGRVESSALPGFWIRAEWLWQSPLPAEPECLREIEA